MSKLDHNSAELMSAYVDGELDASEAAQFEDYLAESPEAREQLEELRAMVQLVGKLPAVEAPPDFYDKVARRLRRRQMLGSNSPGLGLVSLSFHVLSILVILTVAALYMLAQLEREPTALEADPAAESESETETAADADVDRPAPVRP